MPELTQDQKSRIVEELRKRGVTLPCPRCGNPHFTLLDGYFNQPVSVEIGAVVLGGKTVPSVVTFCTRCGFLSQHALGALGLLPDAKEAK